MMASAVVDNLATLSPDPFIDCPRSPAAAAFPSFGWFNPRRISFSRDLPSPSECEAHVTGGDDSDTAGEDIVFEFRLHDPVAMLPADELFSDGKLVPLQLTTTKSAPDRRVAEIRPPESPKTRRKVEIPGPDPYACSPRAPRCTTRWREFLGFKRWQSPKPAEPQRASSASAVAAASASAGASPARSPNYRSLRNLLHRNARTFSLDSALSLALVRDSDSESLSISSSRLSLSSSSSSGLDHDDLPRFSLDSDLKAPVSLGRNAQPPPIRLVRPRTLTSDVSTDHAPVSRASWSPIRRAKEAAPPLRPRCVSIDSPRMNSSGKIVFQGLDRSSSSPGSFTGGPRLRSRGMERSYSAHVRVAPVLNVVPVCSLRGSANAVSVFGLSQLFSPQKKDKDAPNRSGSTQPGLNRPGSGKTKSDRTPRDHQRQVKAAASRDHGN